MVAGGVCGCQGVCMVAMGGMHGCWRACMVAGWPCMLAGGGGMCGCWGVCGCQGVCGWQGACMVAGGCMVARGHVWLLEGMHGCWGGGGAMHRIRRDTVNEHAVCILLECILVLIKCFRELFWMPLSCVFCERKERS